MLDPLSFSIPLPSAPLRPSYPTRRLLQPSPTHPDDYIWEVDYSSASKLLSCPRQGENYLLHSREASHDDSATSFGKLFHSCEELRMSLGLSDAVVQRQRELVADHFLTQPCSPTDHRTSTRMLSVLNLYNERRAADGWPQEIVQHDGEPFLERPFKIPLCTVPVNAVVPFSKNQLVAYPTDFPEWTKGDVPFHIRSLHIIYTGRIDAAIHESNLIFVVDHKTTSRDDGIEQFRLSLQTRGYTWALQKILGRTVAGCIINSITILPEAKTERAKKPRTSFDRKPFFYNEDSLVEWEQTMKSHLTTFISYLVRGYFPQIALSFKSPCSGCDYHTNCQLPLSQRPQDLASELYRDVTWSPIH